jgi:hypothetical protein
MKRRTFFGTIGAMAAGLLGIKPAKPTNACLTTGLVHWYVPARDEDLSSWVVTCSFPEGFSESKDHRYAEAIRLLKQHIAP